eukprot:1180448-Prorocentrum_minimum.AAC.6
MPPNKRDPLRLNAREVVKVHEKIRQKVARPPGGGWRYDQFEVRCAPLSDRKWRARPGGAGATTNS